MGHNLAGVCNGCGATVHAGVPRTFIGPRLYCAPAGGPCHALGVRNAAWTLAPHEAVALAAADAAALNR